MKTLLVLLSALLSSCTNRTVYDASSGLVGAGTEKHIWLSPKKEQHFDVLAFENAQGKLHDEYRHIFLRSGANSSEELIDILNLSEKQLQKFTLITGPERYVPHGFPKGLRVYKLGKSADLILSGDNKRVLRFQISTTTGEKWKIGLSKSNMKPMPISIKDLRELFGDGELFNKLVN